MCDESLYKLGAPDTLYAFVATANTNLDGTGDLQEFTNSPGMQAFKVNVLRIALRGSNDTIRLFIKGGNVGGVAHFIYAYTTTAAITIHSASDDPKTIGDSFIIPAGHKVYGATNGGNDADLYLEGHWLVPT